MSQTVTDYTAAATTDADTLYLQCRTYCQTLLNLQFDYDDLTNENQALINAVSEEERTKLARFLRKTANCVDESLKQTR